MDEFGLISKYFAPIAAREPGALGLRDDAAVLTLSDGARLVCTTDAMVAGVHFLAEDPPGDIARKLVRVNLSDLAAMSARPRWLLLALALPRTTDDPWLAAFSAGLAADCAAFDVVLVGGDTVATDGPLTLSLTALGEGGAQVLTRSGAQERDDIYVSGTIGDGALGLLVAQGKLVCKDENARNALMARYRVPQPRLALGQALCDIATACQDVSDGLLADLGHLCTASGLGARITAASVPLSDAARAAVRMDRALLATVLSGGDDYELVFTAPPVARERLEGLEAGVAIRRIGVMTQGSGVEVSDADILRISMENKGFQHF
jgi:thiamine-monophosphate kinase